jgi:phenol 2-monooxygenase
MSPSADHEGYRIGRVDASTTVVVVGAGPSGLMLAYVTPSFSILDTKVFADVILFVSESRW